jgi:membrane protein required for colicin V production
MKGHEMPSYLDLAVVAVVLISALLALLRGFTREVLAILSWVAAGAAAYYFHPMALPYIRPHVPKENIAQGVAIAAVFFIALILVSIITVKLSDVILDSKIGALDRTLGFIFGAVRGFLLAIVAFVFYGWLAPDSNQPEWVKNARMKPILEAGGEKLHDLVPQDIDALIASIKNKKPAPTNEEPPAESDNDNAKPAEPAAPEKKTEAPAGRAAAAIQTGAAQPSDQERLDALLAGGKGARKAR